MTATTPDQPARQPPDLTALAAQAHGCRACELSHLVACQPWLAAELAVVRAPVLLVLGRPPPGCCSARRSG